MKKPLMYLVRHGSTTDSGLNIFRGQRDSALNKEGFLDAHVLREFFDELDWHRVFCSRMTRSIQTATIICDDQDDYQPETIDNLKPWNIGELTGKPKNDQNLKKMAFYDAHPDVVPPGGESISQFESRVWPILAEAIQLGWKQGHPVVVVAHSSIVHSLNHLLIGRDHKPGGVIMVYMEDGEILHHPIFKPGHDDSSFQKS